jgi:hypothetical protein
MPHVKVFTELLAVERRTQLMSLQCEVLSDRSETRQERLCAFSIAETTHATLAFTRRLMTVFAPVFHSGAGFNENVLHVCLFRELGLHRRIAVQPVSDDLARHFTKKSHDLVAARYERVATILTSTRRMGRCLPRQPGSRRRDARPAHGAYRIIIEGESFHKPKPMPENAIAKSSKRRILEDVRIRV